MVCIVNSGHAKSHFDHSQGHLLELKLAAIKGLEYAEFYSLFGTGCHPDFRTLLDLKIAPHLSIQAYNFWCNNASAFESNFYMSGYSGWALRLANVVFKLGGVSESVKKLCNCDTIEEQVTLWRTVLRPKFLNPLVVAVMRSPAFCWNALGVPLNQRKMVLEDGE